MDRKPLVVGNWKMELSHKASLEVARAVKKLLSKEDLKVEVVVCPSYPSLAGVGEFFKGSEKIQVGAQHVHWEETGAVTGAVSVLQIAPFARWCIVGHSEARELSGQTDEQVREAASLLLKHGLTPIVCLGETREERERGETIAKVIQQTDMLFAGMTRASLSKLVVVYEPIWAISAQGTGQVPEPAEVSEIVVLIRKQVAARFDAESAQRLRILYGGSVTAQNVRAYVSEPGVDGVLVGSASIHPMPFVEIIKSYV